MYFNPGLIEISKEDFSSKTEVLKKIAKMAKKAPALKKVSEQALFDALAEREAAGSTGFGHGIAIPHCRLSDIDLFVMGVLVLKEGVDFGSADGKPVRFITFVFGPESARTRHIKLLSEISRILMDVESYQALITASQPQELFNTFDSYLKQEEDHKDEEYRMIQIMIQDEDHFENILEIVTTIVEGNLVIMESENATSYLKALPLFSSFWTDNSKSFSRVIMAVCRRKLVNDIARRINILTEDLDQKTGILMTSQPLSFVLGSLDL